MPFRREKDAVRDRERERERERERTSRNNEPKKKYRFWDIPPVGFEHLTPKEYKAQQGEILCSFVLDR